jgi:hypothetical protein
MPADPLACPNDRSCLPITLGSGVHGHVLADTRRAVSGERREKLLSVQPAPAGGSPAICRQADPTVASWGPPLSMQDREKRMPQSRKRATNVPALNVQATADVGVSAKYEVRKTITEHVPEDVTRAKTSAWLTICRRSHTGLVC